MTELVDKSMGNQMWCEYVSSLYFPVLTPNYSYIGSFRIILKHSSIEEQIKAGMRVPSLEAYIDSLNKTDMGALDIRVFHS
jgi:hypothetical protein